MKTKSFLELTFLTFLTVGLQSCATTYYQVYDVETEGLQSSKEKIVYNDDNCEIIYDLWCEQGTLNFLFKNNSETDIHIDLSQSFFIRNGIAYDYYVDCALKAGVLQQEQVPPLPNHRNSTAINYHCGYQPQYQGVHKSQKAARWKHRVALQQKNQK